MKVGDGVDPPLSALGNKYIGLVEPDVGACQRDGLGVVMRIQTSLNLNRVIIITCLGRLCTRAMKRGSGASNSYL